MTASRALAPILVLSAVLVAFGDERPSANPRHVHGRKELLEEMRRDEEIARTSSGAVAYAALCRAAAYAFDLAEPGGDDASDIAKRGYELADRARKIDPTRVEAHYRYALDVGLYLRDNKLAGISLTSELVKAGERAAAIDGRYDRGGPHRLLAILYSEAPRFIGPGDRDKARDHLRKLLAVAGDDVENRLVAVRVKAALGEEREARRLLMSVDPEAAPDDFERAERRAEKQRLERELDD